MEDRVALRIRIGLRKDPKGTGVVHDHPDFNKLPSHVRGDMDWASYLSSINGGPFYDHKCGHHEVEEEDMEDPHVNTEQGMWCGCIVVPEAFADEALKLYGDEGTLRKGVLEEINDLEWEEFYDKRHAVRQPKLKIDDSVIKAIDVKLKAGLTLSDDENKALDENDDEPGITKNTDKTWRTSTKAKRMKVMKRPHIDKLVDRKKKGLGLFGRQKT